MPESLSTCLWFDDQAEEAARFYTSVFKRSRITTVTRYGEAGREIHRGKPGTVFTVEFEIEGRPFTALNGGPLFSFSPAVSLVVVCRNQKEIDYYWSRLARGGPKQAQQCGWLKDRFGLSWQVVPGDLKRWLGGRDRARWDRVMVALLRMKKLNIAKLKKAAGKAP